MLINLLYLDIKRYFVGSITSIASELIITCGIYMVNLAAMAIYNNTAIMEMII